MRVTVTAWAAISCPLLTRVRTVGLPAQGAIVYKITDGEDVMAKIKHLQNHPGVRVAAQLVAWLSRTAGAAAPACGCLRARSLAVVEMSGHRWHFAGHAELSTPCLAPPSPAPQPCLAWSRITR